MTSDLHQKILAEAIRIGDQLLAEAEAEDGGLAWRTMVVDVQVPGHPVTWSKSTGLYSGVAGITLFLLELYRRVGEPRFLNAASGGATWLASCHSRNPSRAISFYTGSLGAAHVLLQVARATGDATFARTALDIAQAARPASSPEKEDSDLLGGNAGTLLGLLHLHAATGEPSLLDSAAETLDLLLRGARLCRAGLAWGRNPEHLRSLCGFSHGASGAGYALLECGRYLQNPGLIWLAEQAFNYESMQLDVARGNWPDFRFGPLEEQRDAAVQDYREGRLQRFFKPGNMNAWCHGAAGIGLARLRAFEILHKPIFEEEARVALHTTLSHAREEDENPLLILCHGLGGNAELFLEGFRVLREAPLLEAAERVAEQALRLRNRLGYYRAGYPAAGELEDSSLFMGSAGMGLFYLRVLDPDNVPSILAPRVEGSMAPHHLQPVFALGIPQIRERLLSCAFPRSLAVAERLAPDAVAHFFVETAGGAAELPQALVRCLRGIATTLPPSPRRVLQEILSLEQMKLDLEDGIESNVLVSVREIVNAEEAAHLLAREERELAGTELVLCPGTGLLLNEWDWSIQRGRDGWCATLREESGSHPVLLRTTPRGIVEQTITLFSFGVLDTFRTRRLVKEGSEALVELFAPSSEHQKTDILQVAVSQIKEALASGLLICTGEPADRSRA